MALHENRNRDGDRGYAIGFEIVDELDEIDDMRIHARKKWEARMERIGIDVREDKQNDIGKSPPNAVDT